jgi:hypothetical protein
MVLKNHVVLFPWLKLFCFHRIQTCCTGHMVRGHIVCSPWCCPFSFCHLVDQEHAKCLRARLTWDPHGYTSPLTFHNLLPSLSHTKWNFPSSFSIFFTILLNSSYSLSFIGPYGSSYTYLMLSVQKSS